ncbi:MAG TPA: hypothetical protein VJT74_15185 [Pyrinomonadaceae bacterium]|nr:hypothetical protein [Pyrinomonadaceae bacterium]
MIKARTIISAILLIILPAAAATAQKKRITQAASRDSFPLRVGDSWTYRNDEDDSEYTVKVIDEEKQADGTIVYQVEKQVGTRIHYWYTKAPGWVLMRREAYADEEGMGVTHEPARQYLKNPLTVGAKWTWNGKSAMGMDVTEINEVAGTEVVTTPAGRFRAVKVVSRVREGDASVARTNWYAPGVGLVKTLTEAPSLKYGAQLADYSFKSKSPGK